MPPPDLACVGEIMVDIAVDAPVPGPGRRRHGSIELAPGGSPVTAALWARAAGGAVLVAGRIGDDPAGRVIELALTAHGIETRIARTETAPTGVCIYAGDGVTASRGANRGVRLEDLPDGIRAGAVLVSGYLLLQPDSSDAGRAVLERARARWIAVDAASAELVHRCELDAVQANVLFADADEARALTGEDEEGAVRALGARFEIAFVTLAERGALACSEGMTLRHAEPPVRRRAPAGTGDAFAGTALLSLVRGEGLEAALASGCRAGAACAAGKRPFPPLHHRG